MADHNPSIMHHISIGTNDFDRAVAFYDKVMADHRCETGFRVSRRGSLR